MYEAFAVMVPCSFCGEAAGRWCRNAFGDRTPLLHVARMDPIRAAIAAAYTEQDHWLSRHTCDVWCPNNPNWHYSEVVA